ncbi:hypothetical protein CUN59_08235 [Cuspidothrix issatschenkoi CHARLIE-1]|uniref:Uncharacterized protein n=1 Tax=Cuspidothrix issatschenkoi CHARLIE-1 TaxID=2052836 RepID=A0A2S6CVL2_9CYAN|nr:hypothetical protein CUN59_08235 [Cuspidothrix issatschenkoi CHARLIE-1]
MIHNWQKSITHYLQYIAIIQNPPILEEIGDLNLDVKVKVKIEDTEYRSQNENFRFIVELIIDEKICL